MLIGLLRVHGLYLRIQRQVSAGEQFTSFGEALARQIGHVGAAAGHRDLHHIPGGAGGACVGALGEDSAHGFLGNDPLHNGHGQSCGGQQGDRVGSSGALKGGHLLGRGSLGDRQHHGIALLHGRVHFRGL